MMGKTQKIQRGEGLILRMLASYALTYLAYSPLVVTLVTGVAFATIVIINLTGGDLRYIGFEKFVQLMTIWGIKMKRTYNQNDLLNFFSVTSLILAVAGTILGKLLKLITKKEVVISYKLRLTTGMVTVTLLMLLAQLSVLFPKAATGVENIWWVLVIFWLISMVSYLIHTVFLFAAQKLAA